MQVPYSFSSVCLVLISMVQLSASGIKVDGLTLSNEGYKPWKGVRYITKNGKFQVRS